MGFGLFLRREVITSTRRGSVFSDRRGAACLAAAVIGICFGVWDWWGWDRGSVGGAASFGFWMFGVLVVAEAMLAIGLVLGAAAPAIASERDRKSLDSLLATRVSSADVVLGALGASLLRYANRLAALAPLMVLITCLGGIDPRLVALSFAGIASTAVVTASLSVAVSAGARTTRQAVAYALMWTMAWTMLPVLVVMLLPRIWPAATAWTAPIAVRMLDASPVGVILSLSGIVPRGPLVSSVLKMIAIHAAASALLVAWAIVRLRPASRAAYELDVRDEFLSRLRARWRPRPACGDDPVLWREMHVKPPLGELWLLVDRLCNAAWIGFLTYGAWLFAAPAFGELWQRGYGPGPADLPYPELNPMARMLVSKVSGLPTATTTGQARLDFSIVLRQATAAMSYLFLLMIAGAGTEAVVNERERDTWLGLIATPLTGWEILRAKMLGTLWKARVLGFVILALWTVGLATGALHPLGFLAAVAVTAAASGFATALGVSMSLRSRDRAQASSRVMGPLVLAFGLIAAPFIVPGPVSFATAAAAPPFQVWSTLLSHDDVRDLVGSRGVAPFATVGVRGVAGGRLLLAVAMLGATAQAVAAVLLTRAAVLGFDASVGRPVRGDRKAAGDEAEPCSRVALAS
jgi:ABC-type transport system involved in multi-copper enzyme maturation permease subunit